MEGGGAGIGVGRPIPPITPLPIEHTDIHLSRWRALSIACGRRLPLRGINLPLWPRFSRVVLQSRL